MIVTKSSEHFQPEDWVDLARGILSPSKASQMQTHLKEGCDGCLRSSVVWRTVVELCSREADYYPPDSIVRAAKSAYIPEDSWKWLPAVAQFAKLMFDSVREPAPVGIRSKTAERHMIHEAEPFVIDLRLESDPARKRMFLMGQILNSRDPNGTASRVDIVLLNGDELIKKTLANQLGEFNMEVATEGNQQLFINIRGQRAIGIALPDMNV
jgi:hypothetical protein